MEVAELHLYSSHLLGERLFDLKGAIAKPARRLVMRARYLGLAAPVTVTVEGERPSFVR